MQDHPVDDQDENTGERNVPNRESGPEDKYSEPPKRYKKSKIPGRFLNSHEALANCNDLIDQLLLYRGNQEKFNDLYDDYVHLYQNEMDTYLKELSNTPKSKRVARHSTKPFWCEELTVLWKTFHNAEKCFLKCDKDDLGYKALKQDFWRPKKLLTKSSKRENALMRGQRCMT